MSDGVRVNLVFDGSRNIRSSSVETPDGLPEHLVGLSIIGINFTSKFIPQSHFKLFTTLSADFHASAYCKCKEGSSFKPGLEGYTILLE